LDFFDGVESGGPIGDARNFCRVDHQFSFLDANSEIVYLHLEEFTFCWFEEELVPFQEIKEHMTDFFV